MASKLLPLLLGCGSFPNTLFCLSVDLCCLLCNRLVSPFALRLLVKSRLKEIDNNDPFGMFGMIARGESLPQEAMSAYVKSKSRLCMIPFETLEEYLVLLRYFFGAARAGSPDITRNALYTQSNHDEFGALSAGTGGSFGLSACRSGVGLFQAKSR